MRASFPVVAALAVFSVLPALPAIAQPQVCAGSRKISDDATLVLQMVYSQGVSVQLTQRLTSGSKTILMGMEGVVMKPGPGILPKFPRPGNGGVKIFVQNENGWGVPQGAPLEVSSGTYKVNVNGQHMLGTSIAPQSNAAYHIGNRIYASKPFDVIVAGKMLGVVDEGVVWLRLQQSSGACIAPEDPDEG
jgi:hypothetical protein